MNLSNAKKAGAASGESIGNGPVSNGVQADEQRRSSGRTGRAGAAKASFPQTCDALRANGKPLGVTKEDIAQERAALLADRQLRLDQVLDKHDDLVGRWLSLLAFARHVLHSPGHRYEKGSISTTL